MELAEGMALLDRVTGDFATLPTHIDDLRLAFAVHHQEVDVGLTATGTSALRAFSAYRYSVVRQIILADAGQSFFRLMAGSGSIQSWEPSSTGLI